MRIAKETLANLESLGKDSAARCQALALAGSWARAADEVVTNYFYNMFIPRIQRGLDSKWPGLVAHVSLQSVGLAEGSIRVEKALGAMLGVAVGSPVSGGFTNNSLGELTFTNGQPILFDLDYCLNLTGVVERLEESTNSNLQVVGELPRRFLYLPEVHRHTDNKTSGTLGVDQVNVGATRSDAVSELFWYSFSPLDIEDTSGFVFWPIDLNKLREQLPLRVAWKDTQGKKGEARTIPMRYEKDNLVLKTSDGYEFHRVESNKVLPASSEVEETGTYLATKRGTTVDTADSISVEGVFSFTAGPPAVLEGCVRVNPQSARAAKQKGQSGGGLVFVEPAYSSFRIRLR
ncbi:MAG: hypothetical protein H7A46_05425 [Verrucomicrobiales bacterium]|nr:hypothetical protein [Verrucomicrobiales bacterium]